MISYVLVLFSKKILFSLKKKTILQKKMLYLRKNYNHSHNILRLSDVLLNLPFTTSETMHDYCL